MRHSDRLPEPWAIDPRSGFRVPHSELVKEYNGQLVARRFADKPHPRDFPVRIAERIALPNARPEPEPVGLALNLMWEDGLRPIMGESGRPLLQEGLVVSL